MNIIFFLQGKSLQFPKQKSVNVPMATGLSVFFHYFFPKFWKKPYGKFLNKLSEFLKLNFQNTRVNMLFSQSTYHRRRNSADGSVKRIRLSSSHNLVLLIRKLAADCVDFPCLDLLYAIKELKLDQLLVNGWNFCQVFLEDLFQGPFYSTSF